MYACIQWFIFCFLFTFSKVCMHFSKSLFVALYFIYFSHVVALMKNFILIRSTVHTSKVNDYMPTPMQLDCFCEHCQSTPESPLHSYKLYAIIMHLGATMASGHYVAYTRVCPTAVDYVACPRAKTTTNSASSTGYTGRPNSERSASSTGSGGILRFFKPKSSNSLGEIPSVSGNATPLTLCR